MTPEFVTGLVIEGLKTAVMIASPILVFGLLAGLIVSIFQSATQINEMTLVFIPKMIAVGLAVMIFFPWMLNKMTDFTSNLITNLPMYIK